MIAVVAGLALGAVCGLINGALVAFGGLQPFDLDQQTLSTYRALALIFTGGNPILGVPASFRAVANGYFFGDPGFSDRGDYRGSHCVHPSAQDAVRRISARSRRQRRGGSHCWRADRCSPRSALMFCPACWPRLAALILIGRLGAAEAIASNLWELDAIAVCSAIGGSLADGQ